MAGPLEYFTILANEWIKLIVAPLASPDLLWLLPPPKAELEDSVQPVAPHNPYTEPAQPAQQAPAEPNAKKSLLGKLAFWRR